MADTDDTPPSTPASSREVPIIVGVGASAVAPDDIERFFSGYRADAIQAIVLVVQHREALNEAALRETLDRVEHIEVMPVEHGLPVAGGTVYLCEPDRITTVQDGHFAVRKAEQMPGLRGTIDSFLVSLAEDRAEEAVGVMLAGTGGDGTLGMAALKDQGGLTIAVRPDPGHEHLENSNSPAALADFLLPPEDITEHIRVYVRHLRRVEERRGFDATLAAAAEALGRIADVLRNRTGNDFHGYKQNTFLRRVQRRMKVVQID